MTAAATPLCVAALWGLPHFAGLAGPGAAGALLAGAAFAAAAFGAHAGSRRLRVAVPLLGAGLALALAAAAILPDAHHGGWHALTAAAAGLAAWTGGGPTPAGPAAWVAAAAMGFVLAGPLYAAARADRPGAAAALALLALAARWEFADPAARAAFWPLAAAGILWWAASRIRAAHRAAGPETAVRTAGPAMLLAGAAALGAAYALPRRIGPANLGRLGVWLDRLPVIGPLEKASREGSLTQSSRTAGLAAEPSGALGSQSVGRPATARQPGFSLSQTGFATDVARLGGPVRVSHRTALHLTVTSRAPLPAALYLRGTVRDAYTGGGWRETAAGRAVDPTWPARSAAAVGRAFVRGQALPPPYHTARLRIRPAGDLGGNLFTALLPLQISLATTWNRLGGARPAGSTAPAQYHETVALPAADAFSGTTLAAYRRLDTPGTALVGPLAAYALVARGVPVALARRFPGPSTGPAPLASELQLPANLPPAVAALARRWTRGLRDPLLQALALRTHLFRYPYSLRVPAPPPGQDFVSFFLFEARRGYCTYYASAMAVLLRTLGIASRWVEGFRVPLPVQGGTVAVTDAEAHAWVEAYIPGYGWLTFDATPETTTATPSAPAAAGVHSGSRLPSWTLAALPAAGLMALVGAATRRRLSERARAAADPLAQGEVIWRACERVAGRYGRRRARGETPQEYVAALGERLPGWRGAGMRLAEAYGRLRWGPPQDAASALGAMRAAWVESQDAWRAATPRSYLWRRWL